ncbi:MAG TPA: serine/threonine-protein kinase [Anaeromyxobacteraceae bacterium]|nr:serine/threonine-protein kinase [Anaeromyxobacteraceae bacterium]
MRIGGYDIQARIGRGGMAEVLLAREVGGPRAGAPVVVKRLLPALARDAECRALFGREAELARSLDHPGLVRALGAGAEEGIPYLVLEYVDGRDVSRLLAACAGRRIRLPVDFAAYVAHEVARALDHAHRLAGRDGRALGLVHCDVSPSNVFVSRAGAVKLGDFGVARLAGEAGRRPAFGKVRYLAPEQLAGGPVAPRTDVFGLGATLHELLTGAPAFPGDDPDAVARHILRGERRPPSRDRPEVPPALDEVVLRALAVEDRTPDAAALATALAGCYDARVGTPLAIAALVRGVLGERAS